MRNRNSLVGISVKSSVSLLALMSGLVAPSFAQAQTTPEPEEDRTARQDTIVVTAQKREQKLDEVGMSIDAFSADQLQDRGVSNPEDLIKLIPGFTYTRSQFDQPTYTIRGVGYFESSLAAGPTVSVYVDQVPLPYPSMTRGAILDLERVEVLKGPQGTLFGQNSTGGAVNYIAAKPTDEFEAGGRISYGRFDTVEASGYISGALSKNLRARIAIKTEQSGDWQRSVTRDDTQGSTNFTAARLLVDFEPTDRVRFQLNVNGWADKSDTQAPQVLEVTPVNPAIPLDLRVANSVLVNPGPRDADFDPNIDFSRNNKFFQASLRGDFDLSDNVTLTSITSYQTFDQFAFQDADGTPARNLHIIPRGDINSFSQELRLSGQSLDNRLNWLLGANYANDEVEDNQQIFLGESTGAFVGPFFFDTFFNLANNDIETWAVFGNAEFNLTDNLSVQGGVRYTEATAKYQSCTTDSGAGDLATIFGFIQSLVAFPGPPPGAGECITLQPDFSTGYVTNELNENNVSWRVGLNWHPFADDTLLYANVSQGFKAGSFPTLSASNSGQLDPVTQEELLAYEAGFKTPIGPNVHLNGAAFYYDYKDKQLRGRVLDPIFGQLERLVNIPNSEIYGAELQLLWTPVDGLRLSANGSYLKSEIKRNDDGSDFFNFPQRVGAAIPFTGNTFPHTPELSFSLDGQYDWSVSEDLNAFFGAGLTYQSDTKGGLESADDDRPANLSPTAGAAYNDPALNIDSYILLDLRAGIEAQDQRWRLSVWGKNVTDELYSVNTLVIQDTLSQYAGRPATYGATFTVKY
ncbi:MAG: TonB-dependent receptor [Alphaproteobacteria bacterium]|nr:TonB-dependent receptor [Alphaproteobacteria bacterium]